MTYDSLEQAGSGTEPYELFLFQAAGGIQFALTSAENPVTYLGDVYETTTISRSESEQSNEVISGQLKIYLSKDHPLARLMVPYLPSSPIAVTVYGSHYSDSETVVLFTGTVASARFTDQCELTCNSAQYLLQRKIPQQLYQSPCSHVFGDAGCGASLPAHTYAGTVTAIDPTGTILTIPAFSSLPDTLTGGFLRLGDEYRMVVSQVGATVTLITAMPDLETGDAVYGTAGCALTFSACAHYGRTISFLGFDLIPIVNPFDGSASIG